MNNLNVTKLLTDIRTNEMNKFPRVSGPHLRGGPGTSIATEAVLKASGEPSTWFPLERLVEKKP